MVIFLIEKIILIIILIVGALITYLAKPISSAVKILKSPEINHILIKVIGFVIVLISVVIAFMKF